MFARVIGVLGLIGVLLGPGAVPVFADTAGAPDEELLDLGASAPDGIMEQEAAGPPAFNDQMRVGVEAATRSGVDGPDVEVNVAPPPQPMPWDVPGPSIPIPLDNVQSHGPSSAPPSAF